LAAILHQVALTGGVEVGFGLWTSHDQMVFLMHHVFFKGEAMRFESEIRYRRSVSFRRFSVLSAAVGAIALGAGAASAQQNGTWIQTDFSQPRLWSDSANWQDGVLPSGADAVARFPTSASTGNVILDMDVTIGHIVTGGSHQWHFIASDSTRTMTLATSSGMPTISSSQLVWLRVPVAGTQGFYARDHAVGLADNDMPISGTIIVDRRHSDIGRDVFLSGGGGTLHNIDAIRLDGIPTVSTFWGGFGSAIFNVFNDGPGWGSNRINEDAELILNGGEFLYRGRAGEQLTEFLGPLRVEGSHSYFGAWNLDGSVVVEPISIARNNRGTITFRAMSGPGEPTMGRSNIYFFDQASITSQLVGGEGGIGTTTQGILPYAVGDNAHGPGFGFVTYVDDAGGIRLLDFGTEYKPIIDDGQTQLDNVRLGFHEGQVALVNLTQPTTVNALWLLEGGLTGTGTLHINSGALLAAHMPNVGIDSGVTIDFGDREGIITALRSLTIHGQIAGTNGLTKTGLMDGRDDWSRLTLTNPDSPYTGPTTVNAGVLEIAASGSIGDGSAGNPLILAGGTLRALGDIDSPATRDVRMHNMGIVDTPSGREIIFRGQVSGDILRKIGPGTLVLAGSTSLDGAMNVAEGTVRIGPGAGIAEAGGLSVSGTAVLDLTDNGLIVRGGDLNAITASVVSGYDGGSWAGTGINSSVAAAEAGRALGVAPDGDDVLVKFTWAGDATLDGSVTIADLGILAANWQANERSWFHGDFNYDGSVNIADLGILAANWQKGAGGGMSFEEALAMFDVFSGVVIPEPAALGLLGLGALFQRRRHRC
jgi:autotransporter-associated beta strand protein